MRALVFACALAMAAPALAAETAFPVEIPEGASWTVETLRVRATERDGKPQETRSGSRYRATYRSLKSGGGLLTLRSLDGSLFGAVPGVSLKEFERPLELEVDETLAPVRMRNWPEFREAIFRVIEADKDMDPKALAGVKDMFRKIEEDQAHQIMAPAFNYIGLGQGLALERRKPRSYEGEQPNPIGGAPIKTRATYTLQDVDKKAGRAVIVWTQALEPDSMRAAVASVLKTVAKDAKPGEVADLEAMLAKMSLTRDDRCRFEVHVPTGLATKVECSSTIEAAMPGEGSSRRTDAWTITQSLPEVS